jgi:hypothetical protein
MRVLGIATFAGLLASAAGQAEATAGTRSGDNDGFVALFDGKSLAGWKVVSSPPDAWSAEEGLIVGSEKGGGWLGSHSGVYLRAPLDDSNISRTGLEVRLADEVPPRPRVVPPRERTGSIEHVAPATPGHLLPAGTWNRPEIEAEGTRLVVRLNGATVVDGRLDAPPERADGHPGLRRVNGRIGLRIHGGRVEFGKLQIKERPTARPVG